MCRSEKITPWQQWPWKEVVKSKSARSGAKCDAATVATSMDTPEELRAIYDMENTALNQLNGGD